MNLIVAVSKNWGIGKDGDLLFSIPEDMKFFRETTMGKVVVMGRKTLESFPNKKPLPKRTNIVLTRNKDYAPESVTVCHTPEEVLREVKKYPTDDCFVIGGEEIYRLFIPFCKYAYITRVESDADADSFLPDFTKLIDWELRERSPEIVDNGHRIAFEIYENMRVK